MNKEGKYTMNKVSVIVTVYNTEKYVEECIVSLINQTYKNIEIILIDGGSIDNTPEICRKYESKYKNIRLVHKENEGVSAARNRGITEATGDYIFFVDGDDWIENNTIETLVWLEEENKADISFIIKEGHTDSTGEVLIDDGKKMLLHILNVSAVETWGKLFKKQLFDDIRFPEGKLHEDLYIMPTIFLKCKKVVAYHKGLYHYRIREDGLMGSELKGDLRDLFECWLDGINSCPSLSSDKKFVKELQKRYLYDALWYFYNIVCLMSDEKFKESVVNISLFYKKTRYIYLINSAVKISDRIRFLLISICPMTVRNFNILRYGRG